MMLLVAVVLLAVSAVATVVAVATVAGIVLAVMVPYALKSSTRTSSCKMKFLRHATK